LLASKTALVASGGQNAGKSNYRWTKISFYVIVYLAGGEKIHHLTH